MAILLIILGIGFVALHFYTESESPQAPVSKYLNGGAGILSFLIAVYLFVNVADAWQMKGAWMGFCHFVGTFAALGGGIYLIYLASTADEKSAKDMSFRAQQKDAETRHERNQIELEKARNKAQKDEELEDEKRKTEAAKLRNKRIELNNRNTLAETAGEQGLDVDTAIGINAQKYSTEIQLENYAQTKAIDFGFKVKEKELEMLAEKQAIDNQFDAADRAEHYKIVDELEDKLEELYEKRRNIELNTSDESLKQQKLTRLDKRISQLEADIDGRQDRLLSSAERKEIKRLT